MGVAFLTWLNVRKSEVVLSRASMASSVAESGGLSAQLVVSPPLVLKAPGTDVGSHILLYWSPPQYLETVNG